jgi:hypothetical protein
MISMIPVIRKLYTRWRPTCRRCGGAPTDGAVCLYCVNHEVINPNAYLVQDAKQRVLDAQVQTLKQRLGKIQEIINLAATHWPPDQPSRPHFDRLRAQVIAIMEDRPYPTQQLRTGAEPPHE